MNSIPADLQEELANLRDRKNDIIEAVSDINDGVYDTRLLTDDQAAQLDAIADTKSALYKREDVKKYYEDLAKVFESSEGFNEDFYYMTNKMKNDRIVDREAWLLRNSFMNEELSEEMFEKLKAFPNSYANKTARDLAKAILSKVKDRDGLFNIDKAENGLTDEDKADLSMLYKFIAATNKNELEFEGGLTVRDAQANGSRIYWDMETIKLLYNNPKNTLSYAPYTRDARFAKSEADVAIEEASNWLDQNIQKVYSDYYLKKRNEMEAIKNTNPAEYNKWYEENHVKGEPLEMWTKSMPMNPTENIDKLKPKPHFEKKGDIKDEFKNLDQEVDENGFGLPLEHNDNPEYLALSDNQREVISYLNTTMGGILSHLRKTALDDGGIPAIANATYTATKNKERAKEKIIHEILQDTAGEELFTIPFQGLGLLNQERTFTSRPIANGETQDVNLK